MTKELSTKDPQVENVVEQFLLSLHLLEKEVTSALIAGKYQKREWKNRQGLEVWTATIKTRTSWIVILKIFNGYVEYVTIRPTEQQKKVSQG